jgi:hypothetical protein
MITTKNQGSKGYIESWFQYVIGLQHHSIFQRFLAPSLQKELVSHILAFIKVHFPNLGMVILETLFQKCLH